MDPFEDDKLDRVADFVGGLAEVAQAVGDPQAMTVTVTDLEIALPVEVRLDTRGSEQGEMELLMSPPRLRTKTSIMSSLHSMRIRVVLDHGDQ